VEFDLCVKKFSAGPPGQLRAWPLVLESTRLADILSGREFVRKYRFITEIAASGSGTFYTPILEIRRSCDK